jgi:hypothetical protein
MLHVIVSAVIGNQAMEAYLFHRQIVEINIVYCMQEQGHIISDRDTFIHYK